MAKREKLIEALSNHPNNVTFSDVKALLEMEGFDLDRVTGSHHIFKKENYPVVIYPCQEGGFVAEIPALKGCLSASHLCNEHKCLGAVN